MIALHVENVENNCMAGLTMASDSKRNDVAESRSALSPILYQERAAIALRTLISGRHADKLTAKIFNCSVRMAQHLRRGQFWTIDRLSQASAVLGMAFDVALHPSSDAVHEFEMQDIAERLARLEEWRAEVVCEGDAGLAPEASAAPYGMRGYAEAGLGRSAVKSPAASSKSERLAPEISRSVEGEVPAVGKRGAR